MHILKFRKRFRGLLCNESDERFSLSYGSPYSSEGGFFENLNEERMLRYSSGHSDHYHLDLVYDINKFLSDNRADDMYNKIRNFSANLVEQGDSYLSYYSSYRLNRVQNNNEQLIAMTTENLKVHLFSNIVSSDDLSESNISLSSDDLSDFSFIRNDELVLIKNKYPDSGKSPYDFSVVLSVPSSDGAFSKLFFTEVTPQGNDDLRIDVSEFVDDDKDDLITFKIKGDISRAFGKQEDGSYVRVREIQLFYPIVKYHEDGYYYVTDVDGDNPAEVLRSTSFQEDNLSEISISREFTYRFDGYFFALIVGENDAVVSLRNRQSVTVDKLEASRSSSHGKLSQDCDELGAYSDMVIFGGAYSGAGGYGDYRAYICN